jgi:hypothetical protein
MSVPSIGCDSFNFRPARVSLSSEPLQRDLSHSQPTFLRPSCAHQTRSPSQSTRHN